jgi:hypothetical protein
MSTPGQGVFTPELRFQWVKGQVTSGTPDEGFVACGDGTAFPMEVTLDQLAEIMYRVRDSVCTGSSSLTPVDEFDPVATVAVTSIQPDERLLKTELVDSFSYQESVTIRGYVTARGTLDDLDTPPPMEDVSDVFLSEVYDIGFDYYLDDSDPYENLTVRFREAVQERSIWLQHENEFRYEMRDAVFGVVGFPSIDLGNGPFRTGFSFGSGTFSELIPTTAPAIYAAYPIAGGGSRAFVSLDFNGQVAFADDDNSGNPCSPGNRIYIGLNFSAGVIGGVIEGLVLQSNKGYQESSLTLGLEVEERLILKLSDNVEVSCPLYGFKIDFDGSATPLDDAEGSYYGTDWVFEATEWWPYSKDSPALPVWNTETGAKL